MHIGRVGEEAQFYITYKRNTLSKTTQKVKIKKMVKGIEKMQSSGGNTEIRQTSIEGQTHQIG